MAQQKAIKMRKGGRKNISISITLRLPEILINNFTLPTQ
jgi:hypothetical protein